MALLVLGLSVFFAIHLLPMIVGLRSSLQEKMGALPYKAVFSLVSLAGFYLIILGKSQAPFVSLWVPPSFFKHITMLLVLFAFLLLPAAYIASNIRRKIKNPMLTAVKLWATGHLLANGDLASVLLFGAFLIYAIIDVISVKKRASGSAVELAKQPIWRDILVVVVGLVAYLVIMMNHAQLFGVPVISVG